MARTYPIIIVVSVVLMNVVHATWARGPSITLESQPKDQDKIESLPELRSAVFSHMEQKLRFDLPGTEGGGEARIESIPGELVHDVPYRLKVAKGAKGKIQLTQPRLELLATWDASDDRLFSAPKYRRLRAVMKAIPPDSLFVSEHHREELEQATIEALVRTEAHEREQRHSLADVYYLQLKSYEGNHQIPFSLFEGAREACLSACAIRQRGNRSPHGSGVLIGPNVVLTCSHNFDGIQGRALQCQVIFSFTDTNEGAVFQIAEVLHESRELDFCLVKLGAEVSRDPTADSFKLPVPPLIGRTPELRRHDGIYVAGHPRGEPLSVALNAKVVFPFWVERQQTIDELAEITLLRLFSSTAEYEAHVNTYRDVVATFFTNSYQATGGTGFFFRPVANNRPFPTIGADPNTKTGNSGSPVFDASRNSLVGLLRAGKPDGTHLPEGANFAYFEQVIPISQIADELDRVMPMWNEELHVKVYGD